jgi:hypothetical protein
MPVNVKKTKERRILQRYIEHDQAGVKRPGEQFIARKHGNLQCKKLLHVKTLVFWLSLWYL